MVRRLAVCATLVLSACSFPETPLPPSERQLVVHGLLDPSRRIQSVDLAVNHGAQVLPGSLDSAMVVITTPDGMELVARQDSAMRFDSTWYLRPRYVIDLDDYGIDLIPGGTYGLRVTTRALDEVTGSTVIPIATPAPLMAAAPFVRDRDTLRISWNTVAGARAYELQIWATRTQFNFTSRFITHSVFASSEIALSGRASSPGNGDVFRPEMRADVYLFAVDDNYYEYYRVLTDPFVGAAPSRLRGALGFFGSVVPVARMQFEVQ